MTANELGQELQKIDARFSIVDNPTRPGLSNIFFEGQNYDLPPISSYDIRDVPDATHVYEFPNGARARLWSKQEILDRVHDFLKNIKGNRNLYTDEA